MKQLLENNKIYFQTVVAVLLSIMAIIVSTSQVLLAHKAYELDRLPYLPQITASVTTGGKTCGSGTWELTTKNISGNAYNLRVHAIAFLSIRQLQLLHVGERFNPNVHLKEALIPLRNYFEPMLLDTGATQGKIMIQCTDPLNAMDSAKSSFEKLYAPKGKRSITSDPHIYVVVRYEDRFRTEQVKYFRVDAGGQAVPVSKNLGEATFEMYDRMIKGNRYLEYGSSTGQDIMRAWKANAS